MIEKRVENCLRKILASGQEALDHLKKGHWDQCEPHLEQRRRMFLNFQALEHLSLDRNIDIRANQGICSLLKDVQESHRLLTEAIEKSVAQTSNLLNKVNRGRSAHNGYISTTVRPIRLIKRA